MARIRIDFQEPPVYATEISIRVDDINYGGHLGNDRFLTLCQEARMRFLNSLGYKNELDFGPQLGIIVTDAAVQYKAELFYGSKLKVEMSIGDRNKFGFDLFYRLKESDGKIAALAKTGIVSFDYNSRKVVPFPEEFFSRLANL